jgi:UDP-N-acetylmuramate--alanine ligase
MRHIPNHGEILPQWWDVVIYSAAAEHAPEVVHAKTVAHLSNKKPSLILSYFGFLGEISKYFTTIAIAWTHGKSTTTALVSATLQQTSQWLWCAILGAWLKQREGKNSRVNVDHAADLKIIFDHILWVHNQHRYPLLKKYYFVVEACEYKEHFLELDTDYALITNIERDHADYYTTYTQYLQAFTTFIQRVRHKTVMITNTLWYDEIKKKCPSLQWYPEEKFTFTTMIWWHNHTNASWALHLLKQIEPDKHYKKYLEQFQWLRRRAEILWTTKNDITIISDYAHHPTEIASTITWLTQRYPNQHITYIFQPHQARRIIEFRDNFITVLSSIESPILYNVYAAREDIPQLLAQYSQYTTNNEQDQQGNPTIRQNNKPSITTHHQLWQHLAEKSWWIYIAEPNNLLKKIEQLPAHSILVLMTAWDADFLIRDSLAKKLV